MEPSIVIQKARLCVRILNKVLVVCAIFLAGCASDRDAARNRFISQGTLALQGKENRDEISYWNGTGFEGEPRIVIDLDQQRAYFYQGDQSIDRKKIILAVQLWNAFIAIALVLGLTGPR